MKVQSTRTNEEKHAFEFNEGEVAEILAQRILDAVPGGFRLDTPGVTYSTSRENQLLRVEVKVDFAKFPTVSS